MERIKKILKEFIEVTELLNELLGKLIPIICTASTLYLLIRYGF